MRGAMVAVGSLLLICGAIVVTVADQQRVDALQDARAAVAHAEAELQVARTANYRLAEDLTATRTRIAQQESDLTDTTGFLE